MKNMKTKIVLKHEDIAQRAYEIYVARGNSSCNATDDWMQAEAELLALTIKTTPSKSGRRPETNA